MVQSKANTLKVTISGSYKSSSKEIIDFERVTGIIPYLDEDKANQMIIRRYAVIWIKQAKKLNPDGTETDEPRYQHIQKMRQVFIDSMDENDEEPNAVLSYVGKNIMEMNFEELQDLAAAKDLSAVPLYRTGSLVHARRVAWSEYVKKVLKAVGPEFDYSNQAFNPSKHEPVFADGEVRRATEHVADIEETIDRENLALQGKAKANVTDASQSHLTLPQLKALADSKKIGYHASIGYDALYKKLYGQNKAA